jgi:FkbM family methyltransferase
MKFISYAQNFEDVMLWRALKHEKTGFYIDVGAAWAENDSVTKAFYDNGWRGINLEPNPDFYQQLQSQRIRDINLQLAAGDFEGESEINIIEGTGLSTLDESSAGRHVKKGWITKRHLISVTTLKSIWQQYVPEGTEVNFLKVDVEGFESSVLRGMDWINCRPWIVVVESTLPMSQDDSYQESENILLQANYLFAYADGLNRFYVAQEYSVLLLPKFKYPPNVFDDFKQICQVESDENVEKANKNAEQAELQASEAKIRAEQAELRASEAKIRAEEAELQAIEAKAYVEQAQIDELHFKRKIEKLESELAQSVDFSDRLWRVLDSVYKSRSWRLTAPLRWCAGQFRLFRQHGLRTRFISLLRKIARKINQELIIHPRLRGLIVKLSCKLGLYDQLKNFNNRLIGQNNFPIKVKNIRADSIVIPAMTPSSLKIYTRLKAVIAFEHEK